MATTIPCNSVQPMSDARMHSIPVLVCLAIALARPASGQVYLLRPDRVFDGVAMHTGWSVLVEDGRIVRKRTFRTCQPPFRTVIEEYAS